MLWEAISGCLFSTIFWGACPQTPLEGPEKCSLLSSEKFFDIFPFLTYSYYWNLTGLKIRPCTCRYALKVFMEFLDIFRHFGEKTCAQNPDDTCTRFMLKIYLHVYEISLSSAMLCRLAKVYSFQIDTNYFQCCVSIEFYLGHIIDWFIGIWNYNYLG